MSRPIERRIRWAGVPITAGLAVLLLSLFWRHPLSFMAFLVLGCPLVLAGVLLYLWALAGKDSAGARNVVVFAAIVLLPLAVSGCGGNSDPAIPNIPLQETKSAANPVFDPAAATARVFGAVILEGKAPATPSVIIGGDPFCKMNAQAIYKQGALTTGDGKLRNAIVYVRSGYEGRSYPVPDEPVVLDQHGCVYVPHVLTVMKGQKLRILNSDPTVHNVHARAGEYSAFNIAQPSKGSQDIQVFSRAAMPFKIGCDFHNWMVSYAGVFEHPFHVSTGDSGKYEIRLPPGKYEVAVWHEKYGEKVSSVEVAENDALELNFAFDSGAAK